MNLSEIEIFTAHTYPRFGQNKKNEIVRLLYETIKREKCSLKEIIPVLPQTKHFSTIKNFLLKIRYPHLSKKERFTNVLLTPIKMHPEYVFKPHPYFHFTPNHIYIEKAVIRSSLSLRVQSLFPHAEAHEITTYKDHVSKQAYSVLNYNKRREDIFIIKENFSYHLNCPCSTDAVCCQYDILNIGYGCPYDCSYCFLQGYTNSPGILLPANIHAFFNELNMIRGYRRFGSGQFTDSLALDHISSYSQDIIDYFKNKPEFIFEFKTKSDNVNLLLKKQPSKNIIVSWSLNPENIINQSEWYTAPLKNRFSAAQACQEKGYGLGFHFDPIIHYPNWDRDYHEVIQLLSEKIDPEQIRWISLGCLRMPVKLKSVIENRFPQDPILNGELLTDFDEKLRYHPRLRKMIYEKMVIWLKNLLPDVKIYLCMESHQMYKECGIPLPENLYFFLR
ncbi:MAG: hypothetical protein K8S27_09995 [Candidatus Omnitrophica bacterium]|nr:hypothetical protein [Candidatus Omnitrophota bacterium]